jgi:glycosyltransferase involved in cell wall biosynthesis
MNIVHFSTRLNDGAGKATYRLHNGLLKIGLNSKIIVKHKDVIDDNVIKLVTNKLSNPLDNNHKNNYFYQSISQIPYHFRRLNWKIKQKKWLPKTTFNYNIPFASIEKINDILLNADIVCLHSIQHFLSTESITKIHTISNSPVVWTLHDVEPFTGGCHFNNGCERYKNQCGNCPQLGLSSEKDLSRKIWNKKSKDLVNLPITFVPVTSNSEKQIKQSSLFGRHRVKKIILSVEKRISDNINKDLAREVLRLPQDKKIILFGCLNLDDNRKGANKLLEACEMLPKIFHLQKEKIKNSVILLTFGLKKSFNASNLLFDWIHLGPINDDRLIRLIYHASDVFACPSIDDVGPMMINEAYMCGIPVVAFDSGVGPDLITQSENGFLAKDYNITQFAQGLYETIFNKDLREKCNYILSNDKKCTPEFQAHSYNNLFKELLEIEN